MLCFVFAALVVLLDQLFKRWIFITLAGGGETVLLPGVISLIYVENTGAAFSILADHRWLLVGVSFLASLLLIAILLRYNEGFWGTLGLSAVLGGAVGNLIDRVFNGFVIDMFRPLLFPNFAIFNVADVFITLGGITFCVFFIISSIKSEKGPEKSADPALDDYDEDSYDPYDYDDEQAGDDFEHMSDTKVLPSRRATQEQAQPVHYVSEYEEQGFYTQESDMQESFEADTDVTEYVETELDETEYYEPGQGASEYYSIVQDAPVGYGETQDSPGDTTSTLDALSELESELGSVEDYDVDDLLREYGFEDDDV